MNRFESDLTALPKDEARSEKVPITEAQQTLTLCPRIRSIESRHESKMEQKERFSETLSMTKITLRPAHTPSPLSLHNTKVEKLALRTNAEIVAGSGITALLIFGALLGRLL